MSATVAGKIAAVPGRTDFTRKRTMVRALTNISYGKPITPGEEFAVTKKDMAGLIASGAVELLGEVSAETPCEGDSPAISSIKAEIAQLKVSLNRLQSADAVRCKKIAEVESERRQHLAGALVEGNAEKKEKVQQLSTELETLQREQKDYPVAIAHLNERLAQLRSDLDRTEKEEHRGYVLSVLKSASEDMAEQRILPLIAALKEAFAEIHERNLAVSHALGDLDERLHDDGAAIMKLNDSLTAHVAARLRHDLPIAMNSEYASHLEKTNFADDAKRQMERASQKVTSFSL